MNNLFFRCTIGFMALVSLGAAAQKKANVTDKQIIYGYRDGLALTMTMFKPATPNGKAIISIVSGNWVSTHESDDKMISRIQPFLARGYTVFSTMHSSAPRFAIPDAVEDLKRAVQFIRYNSAAYHIDPRNIGITGTSSGGHLALTIATANDIRSAKAKDPVERVSSKVQAAAVFCPPTDFLNFSSAGFNAANNNAMLEQFGVAGAFRFTRWDKDKNEYVPITDAREKLHIDTLISPAEMVTADDAPTYLMHGDADTTVPLQQSQLMKQKLENAKVPVTLVIKPGAGHGWDSMIDDEQAFAKWFDKYLFK